jgi:predicted transcriptional regulator
MHLLDGYEKEIIKIDDLEKIQKMRGLEEEINNFSNKVKELVDAMQKKIKEENENKLRDIKVTAALCRNHNRNFCFARRRLNGVPCRPSRSSKLSERSSCVSTRTGL